MWMKLKSTGKMIMSNINLNSMRKKILNESKKHIVKHGWNEKLFALISKNNQFKIEEIQVLFPKGYLSLLEFYLQELNIQMTISAKNLNLNQMKTHKRIREIILLRLEINQDEKDLIKRTYFTLLLPQHSKIALIALYKIVDQIWFIAGDYSTDFNFYSKRAILATIYSKTVLHWINHQDFEETSKFLDRQIKKVSNISQIKKQIKNLSNILPQAFKIFKYLLPSRQ